MSIYTGQETQIFTGNGMLRNATSFIKIELVSIQEDFTSYSSNEMVKTSLKWDFSQEKVTRDPKTISEFKIALTQLCSKIGKPKKVVEFMDKMEKFVKIIPISELKWGEELIRNSCQHIDQLNLYYELLATSPSDDTVEFLVG